MGKMKSKALEVFELYENGYDIEDITYVVGFTTEEVVLALEMFGIKQDTQTTLFANNTQVAKSNSL